jgi:quercetin dioxygenase-like cupin family protein
VSVFHVISHVAVQQLVAGVTARAVHGEHITLAYVELDAGAVLPEHAHPNEQVGLVIAGAMTFRIGDETRDVRAGDSWCIPPNVLHEVHTGLEGAVVVETFSPVRSDWSAIEAQSPRATLWP